jgi:type IV secretory pathway component VirB8
MLKERDEQQQDKIDKLEERNKWLARALGAATITAGIGLIVAFIKIGMGI